MITFSTNHAKSFASMDDDEDDKWPEPQSSGSDRRPNRSLNDGDLPPLRSI